MGRVVTRKEILMLIIFGVVSLSSCTQLKKSVIVPITSPRFESPELSDKFENITIGVDGVSQTKIIVVPEIGEEPLTTDSVHLKTDSHTPELSLHLSLPIYRRMEVSIDTYGRILLRSQIFGQNRQNAQAGNLSGAFSVGYNNSSNKVKEVDADWTSNNSHEVNYHWNLDSFHYNFVLGYRPLNNVILYGGPRYTNYSLSGELQQLRMGRIYADDYEYVLNGNGFEKGFGFGVELLTTYMDVQQAIVYTVTSSQVYWGNYTSNIQINHGIMIKYNF